MSIEEVSLKSRLRLFALGTHLQAGANLLAIQVSGPSPVFDLDVFRVPCVDTDWYY